jgi:hypothetical protein
VLMIRVKRSCMNNMYFKHYESAHKIDEGKIWNISRT